MRAKLTHVLSFFLADSDASEFFRAARAASLPDTAEISGVTPSGWDGLVGLDVDLPNPVVFDPDFGGALGWKFAPRDVPRRRKTLCGARAFDWLDGGGMAVR